MEEQQKLKDKLEQMKANPVRDPSDLLYMVVQSSLQYWRYHMLQKESQEDIGRDLEIQLTGEEDLDPFIAGIQQDFIHLSLIHI